MGKGKPNHGKKKRKPICDGSSTTHADYLLLLDWLFINATVRVAGPDRLEYFESPLTFGPLGAAVFEGHPRSLERMRGVFTHMFDARKPDGTPCCDWIPLKGNSQNKSRLFCERADHDTLLVALQDIDSGRVVKGLLESNKRANTEAVRNMQNYSALASSSINQGDFEGYRLFQNAVDETNKLGRPREETLTAIAVHLEA